MPSKSTALATVNATWQKKQKNRLPPRTFACTVSSELLGFDFYFFHYFSFLGRALD